MVDDTYAISITEYLIVASEHYSLNSNAEVFIKIIQGVEKMLPDNILFYQTRKAIVQLFYDIQNVCSAKVAGCANNELSVENLLNGIISETKELVPENTLNYTDIFLYDFLDGLFGYYELSEISVDNDNGFLVNAIATALNNVPKFSPMRCQIDNVIKFLKKYDSQIDDELIKNFIERIISRMMKKYEITEHITNLIKWILSYLINPINSMFIAHFLYNLGVKTPKSDS